MAAGNTAAANCGSAREAFSYVPAKRRPIGERKGDSEVEVAATWRGLEEKGVDDPSFTK